MRVNCLLTVVLALLVAMPAWSADAKSDDTTGTWTAESAEMAGQKLPDSLRQSIKLVINGDKYKLTMSDRTEEGTSKSDATATPKTLDIKPSSGPNKGKTMQAIYELDGDTLKVCYDLSGSGRPKEFKTMPGSQLFLVTYKKSKA